MVALYSISLPIFLSLSFNGAIALEPRFVGSDEVPISDYPFQLSIYYGRNNVCGATIIAPRWAITAANCLDSKTPSMVNLRAGSNTSENGGTVHQVSNFYIHPKYNSSTEDYSVALLNVTRPFVYGKNVRPAPVIAANITVPAGTFATITGWGFVTNTGPDFSYKLRRLIMQVLEPNVCSNSYKNKFNPNTMMCTRNYLHVKGLCARTGFPLTVSNTLVGVFSVTRGCTSNAPIFTNLSAPSIRSWISSIASI